MKKLLFLSIIFLSAISYSQTGTIVDNETYFQVNYPSGDVVDIGKDQIVHLKSSGSNVFVMSAARWGSDPVTRIITMKPSDFGFSSTTALRDYLSKICFRAYRVTYTYNGSGNLTTVNNYIGDSLMFSVTYTYDGSTITGKSAPTN
jgi:hypothetical protein